MQLNLLVVTATRNERVPFARANIHHPSTQLGFIVAVARNSAVAIMLFWKTAKEMQINGPLVNLQHVREALLDTIGDNDRVALLHNPRWEMNQWTLTFQVIVLDIGGKSMISKAQTKET
jgi:hypothetical protein